MAKHRHGAEQEVAWRVPRWSYVPGTWRVWRRLFSAAFVLRVTIVSLLAMAAIVAACKLAFPWRPLNFVWKALLAIPSMLLYLSMMMLVQAAFPRRCVVRPDRILVTNCLSTWTRDKNSVLAARLAIFAPERIRLRIT